MFFELSAPFSKLANIQIADHRPLEQHFYDPKSAKVHSMTTDTKTAEQEQTQASDANEQVSESDELGPASGESESDQEGAKKIRGILAMRVPVIVKIAEKDMGISAILKLNLGSVITFEKDAYQNVDLMVNNSTIGLGQPVKIGENFGLRIIQINDIQDTIKSLGGGEG